ncbi:MAG: pitrilysin family protein [Nannocystaceae bacterium]
MNRTNISVRSRAFPLVRWGLRLAVGGALVVGACKTEEPTETPEPTPQRDDAPQPAPIATGRHYPSPPPPAMPKPVNFPEVASFALPNGLTTYVIENHEVPIVTAQLVVRCGQMDHAYLADFAAQMLGEGTRSRSKAKLDEAIEFVGGQLGASAGMHVSTVFARSLEADLKLAMLLMADEVLNPLLPPSSLDKLKQAAKANLSSSKSQPDILADTLFDMVVYPKGHPYGRPLATDSEIDAIDIEDVRQFHQTFYQANNAFLLLSGDVTVATARPLVERAFGRWSTTDPATLPENPLNRFTRYELPGELLVHLVDRPGSAQATVRVGNLALARNDEDWPALEVANQLLGGGPSSRLFLDLREEEGLTYRIESSVSEGQAPGTFVISTQTRTPSTGAMLAGIFGHITRLRRKDPPEAELETTVRTLVGSFPLEIETPDQIVSKVRDQIIFDLPAGYWKSYRGAITQVELSQVRQAAQRYIHALPVVVLVGDAEAIRPQVEQVLPDAKIVLYDDELRRR